MKFLEGHANVEVLQKYKKSTCDREFACEAWSHGDCGVKIIGKLSVDLCLC